MRSGFLHSYANTLLIPPMQTLFWHLLFYLAKRVCNITWDINNNTLVVAVSEVYSFWHNAGRTPLEHGFLLRTANCPIFISLFSDVLWITDIVTNWVIAWCKKSTSLGWPSSGQYSREKITLWRQPHEFSNHQKSLEVRQIWIKF